MAVMGVEPLEAVVNLDQAKPLYLLGGQLPLPVRLLPQEGIYLVQGLVVWPLDLGFPVLGVWDDVEEAVGVLELLAFLEPRGFLVLHGLVVEASGHVQVPFRITTAGPKAT